MRYVQTSDNTFIRHIYNEVENIQWNDSLNTSVRRLSQSQREEFGISRLKMVTPPFFNTDTHIRKEGDALLINGIWTQNWIITDAERNTYNIVDNGLYADLANQEQTSNRVDFTSNGFKIRINSGELNTSSETHVYAAFAEHPFKYARAR